MQDYSPGTSNYGWVERTLAGTDAKFVFLLSHYPAWASGQPTEVNAQDDPLAYQGREYLMPLLATYDATAMVAGHWHSYERSEPTDGVTVIVNGGGGGRRPGTVSPSIRSMSPGSSSTTVFPDTFRVGLRLPGSGVSRGSVKSQPTALSISRSIRFSVPGSQAL